MSAVHIKPLRMPVAAPKCWDSQKGWEIYKADAELSAGPGFTYCVDCTAPRQEKMKAAGRCAFPRTIFVDLPDGVVGRRRR